MKQLLSLIFSIALVSGCSVQNNIKLIELSHIDKKDLQNHINKLYRQNKIIKSKSELDHIYKNVLARSQSIPKFKTAKSFTLIKYSFYDDPQEIKNVSSGILKVCGNNSSLRGFSDGGKKYYLSIFNTINYSVQFEDLKKTQNLCFQAIIQNSMSVNTTNVLRIK